MFKWKYVGSEQLFSSNLQVEVSDLVSSQTTPNEDCVELAEQEWKRLSELPVFYATVCEHNQCG